LSAAARSAFERALQMAFAAEMNSSIVVSPKGWLELGKRSRFFSLAPPLVLKRNSSFGKDFASKVAPKA
jgi:hypothetical protein